MDLAGKNNKARILLATSCLTFGVFLSHGVLAQSTAASQGAAAVTPLPLVVVQSPKAKRTKLKGSSAASRSHVAAGHSRSTRHGNAASVASGAGAGTQHIESAWGHVDGYVATRSGTGTKTDTPLIETPASVSVVTRDQIQAQAAQNISQALRYTSGTRAELSGADSRFDNIYVRGFQADMYLDGMKLFTGSFSTSIIEPYNLERVEVLHGPASVLYGQASPGGVVDMVSKRPTEDPYHEVFLSTGNYGRIQGGVDLSGPIDEHKEWLYRITASGFDVGDQVDFTRYERISIAPSLTWRPDTDTTVTFLGTYQNDPKAGFFNELPAKGYGTLFPLASGQFIPTSFYPGVPSVDEMKRDYGQIGYLAEHRFDDVWTVRQHFRYNDVDSSITTVYPTGVATTDPNSLARSGFFENENLRTFDLDNQVEAKFATGSFIHTALFGIDYQHTDLNYTNGAAAGAVPPISVSNPFYATPIPMVTTGIAAQNSDQVGLYAQDQIKLDRWIALLGVRWDQADSNTQSHSLVTGATTTTKLLNDATTKRAALLYKFDNGVAPYIQYTESFQPQVGTAFGGSPYVPTTGQQEEAGIKYQPNAKSLYTMAVFNLLQQNVLTPDPNSTHVGFSVQTGEIRSRGLELEGKTEIDNNLALLGSYTYLDNVITRSNVAYETGRHPYGMPMNSASLWADYTFHSGRLDGFGLAGGVRYIGDTAGNITGTTVLDVPAVTLFDAAVHYDFSALGPQFKGYSFQLNATNLFDKTYVTLCQDAGCYYGPRRQVIATLRYRW